jgi:NAD-dependent SIR2 family protein deacetylase
MNDRDLNKIVKAVKNAKYLVIYTGAGCSAGSGLGTFRGVNRGSALVREDLYDTIFPSFAHRAIAALEQAGLCKFVITSNHDNLHIKSGLPSNKVGECFGNAYVERCLKCDARFNRRTAFPALSRSCELCGGKLKKTGCRYGQTLDPEPVAVCWEHAEQCDVAIVLGSGMHTGPFCDMPRAAAVKKMFIVNLGETGVDNEATLKLDMSCDAFMRQLCDAVHVDVRAHVFEQSLRVLRSSNTLTVTGAATNECCTFANDVVRLVSDASLRVVLTFCIQCCRKL